MAEQEYNKTLIIDCSIDFHDQLRVSESYDGLSFSINDEAVVIQGLDLVRLRDKINLHIKP